MNIGGNTSFSGQGFVLSGYYAWGKTGSLRPKLFEFSSPSYPITNFQAPYDAVLPNPNAYTGEMYQAVGRKLKSSSDPIYSSVSGTLYYYDRSDLVGTCHGLGRNDMTYYSGFNFYNAFYPMGYFQPPYGETTAFIKYNKDEMDNLQMGACFQMSVTEYNEQFGIISKTAPDVSASTDTLTPNTFAQVMSLKETCPDGTIAVSTYYEEVQAKLVPGTASSLTSPTFYNHDPIPTSLDNYHNDGDSRYNYVVDTPNKVNKIQFQADGRPKPSYSASGTSHSKLNNVLCYAQLFETDTMIGKLTNGIQRIETPDTLWGAIGSQVSAAGQEPWHYWHFTFRENADSLPFDSYFKQIRPGVTRRTISEGTQLFTPILSSVDMYWQNRQCPDTVDFLPHTFGASIYACPSEHFDIPYYASIKRFGFYGTRFLNACKRLNLTQPWNGVSGALEVTATTPPSTLDVPFPDTEPDGIDDDGSWSFADYDNLLRTAKAEERYSNMYALNKGFFLWANTGCIYPDPRWILLVTGYDGVGNLFSGMVGQFQDVYQSGLSSFISGEPTVVLKQDGASTTFSILDSGKYADILFTNDVYDRFKKQLLPILSGQGIAAWSSLEDDYAYYISNCNSGINEAFYANILSGRNKRLRTRFMENFVRGNPIDLFPMNHVYFSTDEARSYYESTGWGRIPWSFGKSSMLPPITRRYFEGAYGNGTAASGVGELVTRLSISNTGAFYPGFFNALGVGKELPTPYYVPTLSGYIKDTAGRKYSASGWLAVGYGEVGRLDYNFSCFTPIFTQQPLQKVFCKIGQPPTFRAQAVDYHSIPEDKISYRYPEIMYWTHKLKLTDGNFKNKYPLKYKWFRVPKTRYDSFTKSGDFSYADFSNPTGTWCALEGDNRNTCTVIHPTECVPQYANHTADAYTFLKGAQHGQDDQYYYFCMAIGRFGVRISEPAELVIENWLHFDVSVKNGMNAVGNVAINFIVNDKYGYDNTISFSSDAGAPYRGFQLDKDSIPETVVEQKIPPPNAGFGDVSATRFVGPNGWVGATRSYAPDTLKDTRGLREAWGKLINYGELVSFTKKLSQLEGELLYGYKHLPTCTNYTMAKGQKGIRVEAFINGNKVIHWTLDQQAFAATDSKYGMRWDKINGLGSLYPPASSWSEIVSPSHIGMGHWQWGNNLGSIKRFGALSKPETKDLVVLGPGYNTSTPVDPILFNKIKDKFIKPDSLAGKNCGYTPYGIGRNMLYYIEAFDRFYLICDPVKKKNVQNISFMCPGLRYTNSAIQYFWLGKPRNVYLERRPMFGPYAYQWRVRRHNRDRNGNGMSEGFYSMNWSSQFELMYDAPAIYGLYVKRESSPAFKDRVKNVKTLRKKIFGTVRDVAGFRGIWFGEAGSEGTSRRYGNITFSCDPTNWAYNEDMCNYVSAAKDLANALDFDSYTCPEERLQAGACFDPCLSIRWGQGFFPGGKNQSMFGYTPQASANLADPKNIRVVGHGTFKNGSLTVTDERSPLDTNTYFRSSVNTPHARIWRGLRNIPGISSNERKVEGIVGVTPCRDGGSDHCNYITATIHLDTTSSLVGQTTAFNSSLGYASSIYYNMSARGDD